MRDKDPTGYATAEMIDALSRPNLMQETAPLTISARTQRRIDDKLQAVEEKRDQRRRRGNRGRGGAQPQRKPESPVLAELKRLYVIANELCTAIDNDIGGSRSTVDILADLGPEVDRAALVIANAGADAP